MGLMDNGSSNHITGLNSSSKIQIEQTNIVFQSAITIYLVVISLGISVSNALIIKAVMTSKVLHKKTYYIQASLAVADLLVGIVIIPLYITGLHVYHPQHIYTDKTFCVIVLGFCLFIKTATILNLLSLTIERYLAICHTILHKNLSSQRYVARSVIGATWLVSLLLSGVSLFGIDYEFSDCVYYKVFPKDLLLVAIIMGVFLPYSMMVVVYTKIFLSIKTHLINICRTSSDRMAVQMKSRKMLAKRKMTITFCLIFVSFGIAWLPFFATVLIQSVCLECKLPEEVNDVILLFGLSHSLANPIIYSIRQKVLRKAILKSR